MLTFITEVPTDKPVSGVHCIPVLDNGNVVMVWDRQHPLPAAWLTPLQSFDV
jgi:hypothetical protein